MLTSRGLPSYSTCILKAEPGKLDIKRREPGILFISLHKKVQRHHDLIKVTCREILKRLLGYVEIIQLIIGVTDKKRLLGYVETIQLILGVTDK